MGGVGRGVTPTYPEGTEAGTRAAYLSTLGPSPLCLRQVGCGSWRSDSSRPDPDPDPDPTVPRILPQHVAGPRTTTSTSPRQCQHGRALVTIHMFLTLGVLRSTRSLVVHRCFTTTAFRMAPPKSAEEFLDFVNASPTRTWRLQASPPTSSLCDHADISQQPIMLLPSPSSAWKLPASRASKSVTTGAASLFPVERYASALPNVFPSKCKEAHCPLSSLSTT